jgi:hypothetical protein
MCRHGQSRCLPAEGELKEGKEGTRVESRPVQGHPIQGLHKHGKYGRGQGCGRMHLKAGCGWLQQGGRHRRARRQDESMCGHWVDPTHPQRDVHVVVPPPGRRQAHKKGVGCRHCLWLSVRPDLESDSWPMSATLHGISVGSLSLH